MGNTDGEKKAVIDHHPPNLPSVLTRMRPEQIAEAILAGQRDLEDAGRRLAALGWATPMSWQPRDVYDVLEQTSDADIDRRFVELFSGDSRGEFDGLVGKMVQRDNLSPWHTLIEQAESAYRRNQFAITVPALLITIEGVLTRSEGSRTRPLQVIDERIRELEARNPDLFTLSLWRIARAFASELYGWVDFSTGPRPILNRHWILHGREPAAWDQADSLRVFIAVDTMSILLS